MTRLNYPNVEEKRVHTDFTYDPLYFKAPTTESIRILLLITVSVKHIPEKFLCSSENLIAYPDPVRILEHSLTFAQLLQMLK